MPANSCPKCGGPVTPGALGGHCPVCLLDGAGLDPDEKSPSEFNLPAKDRRFGDYILGRQLGGGGMGIVYEAHQVSLNRKVALKFIRDSQVASPTLLRRFTIEAEATARLHHPGIVGIHEVGEIDGQPYFSMDLVEGDSLRSSLGRGRFAFKPVEGSKSNGRSVQVEIARLISKTARAVHHAHQRGVLHRDLKPANILVDRHGEPRLTDFGLAKILHQTTEQSTSQSLTGSGDIAGTPSYMSPEQASSEDSTAASDVYGLGAVLYELLTGQPPFKAPTPLETLKQVQAQHPRRPRVLNPGVNRDLEIICLKCLEKDPRYRFASAEALAEDLDRWIEDKPILARPPSALVRTRQWVKRNRAGAALIATLFAGLAATLLLLAANKANNRRVEYQRTVLFDEKLRRLDEFWADPGRSNLIINAGDLATLGSRDPADEFGADRLAFGTSLNFEPVNLAQATYTPVFPALQAAMSRRLKRAVVLDLKIYKRITGEIEPILSGELHFMAMEATSYVLARKRNPGLTPVMLLTSAPVGSFVTSAQSGIREIADLKGRSLLFTDKSSTLSVWGRACLVDAGILQGHLRTVTNLFSDEHLTNTSSLPRADFRHGFSAVVGEVVMGRIDAGLTVERRYEQYKHQGLNQIDKVSGTPRVLVARAGLPPEIIEAFLSSLPRRTRLEREGELSDQMETEDSFQMSDPHIRVATLDDTYFNPLRKAMRKAARFDGLPDPFPELGAMK